jgi:hypothetical protein
MTLVRLTFLFAFILAFPTTALPQFQRLNDGANGASYRQMPGGVQFGRSIHFSEDAAGEIVKLEYKHHSGLTIETDRGQVIQMPRCDQETLLACYLFALDSGNHSAINIDSARQLYMANAFVDTRIGMEIANVDLKPWKYMSGRGNTANKSVVRDEYVGLVVDEESGRASFQVVLRVGYAYQDKSLPDTEDVHWFHEEFFENRPENGGYRLFPRPRVASDMAETFISQRQLLKLATEIEAAAECACWVSFFRFVRAQKIENEIGFRKSLMKPVVTPESVRDWTR